MSRTKAVGEASRCSSVSRPGQDATCKRIRWALKTAFSYSCTTVPYGERGRAWTLVCGEPLGGEGEGFNPQFNP
eukprot:6879434-Prymnesium_polylepis.1